MQPTANDIFAAAVQLPQAERLSLVSKLMETIPEADWGLSIDDDDLLAELDRRFGDTQGSVAWSELKNER